MPDHYGDGDHYFYRESTLIKNKLVKSDSPAHKMDFLVSKRTDSGRERVYYISQRHTKQMKTDKITFILQFYLNGTLEILLLVLSIKQEQYNQ